jgi:hypothetical protein
MSTLILNRRLSQEVVHTCKCWASSSWYTYTLLLLYSNSLTLSWCQWELPNATFILLISEHERTSNAWM